jgi:hypothetical protein
VESYDAAKVVGPGYTTWSTNAPASTHRSGRTVHALVFVPYAGGVEVWDTAKVTLAYSYALLQ